MWSCQRTVTRLDVARLAWFLKCIGVLSCEEMDVCNPPDLDMVAQAVLLWAGSCRQQLLHAGATVQNTYVQCIRTAPPGEESRPHPYLRAGLRIPHSLVLSIASVAITWGWNLAGNKEWFGLRVAANDVQLWECTTFLWMTYMMTSLQDLMCCRDVYGVALFVHKCMKIADEAAVAAARQQPR
jgi:hypothetical protein